jgi:hypothetical protein
VGVEVLVAAEEVRQLSKVGGVEAVHVSGVGAGCGGCFEEKGTVVWSRVCC